MGTPLSILPGLQKTIDALVHEFDQISADRQSIIGQLTGFVQQGINRKEPVLLNFICTHNSRRSHLAQIWAQTAAYYYRVNGIECYSGGTESTAFNPRAVNAMKLAGFDISVWKDGDNPIYNVKFSPGATAMKVYSKQYDDVLNPHKEFAAIMTCSQADQDCPIVPGASRRIALTYSDPKDFDGTAQEAGKYAERVREIGREMLYAFSQVVVPKNS